MSVIMPRSSTDPITTNANSIDGFFPMLEAVRDTKVQRSVYSASSSNGGVHPALPKVEAISASPGRPTR